MTRKDFLTALWKEGFTTQLIWSAKSMARAKYDDVFCYAVYAPSGVLLTSIIVSEMDGGGFGTFYANENLSVESDLQRLRDMAAKVAARAS